MKEMLMKMALPLILNVIEEMITPENVQKYGAKLFNLAEEFILDSETTVDDQTILPLVRAARLALGIQ